MLLFQWDADLDRPSWAVPIRWICQKSFPVHEHIGAEAGDLEYDEEYLQDLNQCGQLIYHVPTVHILIDG